VLKFTSGNVLILVNVFRVLDMAKNIMSDDILNNRGVIKLNVKEENSLYIVSSLNLWHAKDYRQRKGVDYFDTYALVARISTY
jgi:hypothetical protein